MDEERPYPPGGAAGSPTECSRVQSGGGVWLWRCGVLSAVALMCLQAFLLFSPGTRTGQPGAVDAVEVGKSLAVTLVMFFTAWRMRSESRRLFLAWLSFGLAFLFSGLGDACWAVFRIPLSGSDASILLNAFYLLYYPFFLLGALGLPRVSLDRRERTNLLLETGIVTVAAAMVFWNLLQRPVAGAASANWIRTVIASAYPAGDLALLWAFLTLLFGRKRKPGRTGTFPFLAASASILIASDMLYSYALVGRDQRLMIWVGLSYTASQLMAVLAALRQLIEGVPPSFKEVPAGRFLPRRVSLYLAYSCLAGAVLVLLWAHREKFSIVSAVFVLAMIGLVVAHQEWAARDNRRLYRQLELAKDHLEERIAERTDELARANRDLEAEILERGKAEESMRRSEERFRALVHNSYDIITVHDAEGRLLYETPSLSRILAYAPGSLTGRNLLEIVHPDDLAIATRGLRETLARTNTGVPTEYRIRRGDGTWAYVETLSNNLLHDPAVGGIVLTSRETTERRQAREALAASEDRFRRLSEATFEGIGISENGRIIDANRQLAEMFGCELDELIGREVKEFVAPEHVEGVMDSIRSEEGGLFEHTARRVDGSVLYVETQGRDASYKGKKVRVSVVRDITERKRAESRIRLQIRRLEGLRAIDMAIAGSHDVQLTLSVLLEQVTQQLEVDAACILLFNRETNRLEFGAGRGFRTEAIHHTNLTMGDGYAGRAAKERRMVEVRDLSATPREFSRSDLLMSEGFHAYFAAPLIACGQVEGVFEVFHRDMLNPDEEWRNYLRALAGQAAIALDNIGLFRNLQRSNEDLRQAYEVTLEGWSRALELKDRETQGHTMRVTDMTMRLAKAVGMDDEALTHVRRGALLHDIGKMGIPDSILLKPGPLSDEEWVVMRRHTEFALTLLLPITYLRPALDIPYCHHERWNGSGYPRGLKGEEIPVAARVFAVVDNWDALSFDRPYRAAWPRKKVLAYLSDNAGILFDPGIVSAFCDLEGASAGPTTL